MKITKTELKTGTYYDYKTTRDMCPKCNSPLSPIAKVSDNFSYFCDKCNRKITSIKELI